MAMNRVQGNSPHSTMNPDDNSMLRKVNLRRTLLYGFISAIVFCIPTFFFIRSADYNQAWLLYVGAFLFMIIAWYQTIEDSSKRRNSESTISLVFASHVTTIAGIFLACVFCFLMLVILVPGYLSFGTAGKVLKDAPANNLAAHTRGLSGHVFFAATIFNFSVGSFAGIVLPFYMKWNQTRDSKEPAPLHQSGSK
ncbi:MAG TPA: hypothetical protein VGC95_05925 [Chitinophagaceae bacterium]